MHVQLLLGLTAVSDCVPIKLSRSLSITPSPGVELAVVPPVTPKVTFEPGTGPDCAEVAVVMPPVTASVEFESCDRVEFAVVMPPVTLTVESESCDSVKLAVVTPPVTVTVESESCDRVELAVVMPPVTLNVTAEFGSCDCVISEELAAVPPCTVKTDFAVELAAVPPIID